MEGGDPPAADSRGCREVLSPRSWWALHYVGTARPIAHFVDITTQPIMADGRIEMIDLDPGLRVQDDGTVRIVDEDEVEVDRVELDYGGEGDDPPGASGEGGVAARLRQRQEPFFEVADEWLELVMSSPFPDPAPE